MPVLTPGNSILVLKPRLWWAPVNTLLPSTSLPFDSDWSALVDAGWTKVKDTVFGVQVTRTAPSQPIIAEGRGVGVIRSEGTTVLAFQVLTFTESLWLKSNYMTKQTVSTGTYDIDSAYLDPTADHAFMVGFEGIAKAGTAFSTDKLVRGFGYRCEQTPNAIETWRYTGVEAVIKPSFVLECFPADYQKLANTMITGTGITRSLLDPACEFNYFWVNEDLS